VEKKKRTIWQTVFCVGMVCLIWGGYFIAKNRIDGIKYREITLFEDDFSWVYQVDAMIQEEKKIVLHGFAFELGTDATKDKYEVVLHDIESEENYFMKMEYMNRVDVNNYFSGDNSYLLSGFKASIDSKEIDLEKNNYEILLRVLGEDTAYHTGTYISNGRVDYVNPLEYKPLDVVGTELEEIVENGCIRVYRPDYGMYVYQYEGELYWIALDNYGFVDDDTLVQYLVQGRPNNYKENVFPEESSSNILLWEDKSFKFSSNEVNCTKYRVSKSKLPMDFCVIKIGTGNYQDDITGWIWREYFRPRYDF